MSSSSAEGSWIAQASGPWQRYLAWFAAFTAYAMLGCGALAQVPDGCEKKPDPPLVDFSQPPNIDFLKRQLLYYRCTRYEIDVGLLLAETQRWVATRARRSANLRSCSISMRRRFRTGRVFTGTILRMSLLGLVI
jgi:hypothetical protein